MTSSSARGRKRSASGMEAVARALPALAPLNADGKVGSDGTANRSDMAAFRKTAVRLALALLDTSA
jgi:hypothetical protein